MIRFIKIDENKNFNEEEKEIMQRHVNTVFRHVNAFMICMVPGFVPEEQIPPLLMNDPMIKDPIWACPVSMGNKEQSLIALRELIIKVFDESNFHELNIGEKYALAQISNIGIQREERAIQSFVDRKKKKDLNKWMRNYRIRSEEERETIRKKLLDTAEDMNAAEEWLEGKGMTYRNYVIGSIGCLPLVKYEYPNAIMALFSDEEWERILKMQDLERAIGRGGDKYFE